jgi:hypothetical protein
MSAPQNRRGALDIATDAQGEDDWSEVIPMTAWVYNGDTLACRWPEVGKRTTQSIEPAPAGGSYLPPLPDFAAHSPFGGATWFTPHLNVLPVFD